jgi:hypothetical protein
MKGSGTLNQESTMEVNWLIFACSVKRKGYGAMKG